MAMSATSINCFVQSCKILEKYSLASMIEDMPIQSLNELITIHKDTLIGIKNYDDAIELGNRIATHMAGFSLNISSFISSEADLKALYTLLIQWRDAVLTK